MIHCVYISIYVIIYVYLYIHHFDCVRTYTYMDVYEYTCKYRYNYICILILIFLFTSYLIDNGIVYLILTNKSYPKRLAFLFLEEIAKEFEAGIYCAYIYE